MILRFDIRSTESGLMGAASCRKVSLESILVLLSGGNGWMKSDLIELISEVVFDSDGCTEREAV